MHPLIITTNAFIVHGFSSYRRGAKLLLSEDKAENNIIYTNFQMKMNKIHKQDRLPHVFLFIVCVSVPNNIKVFALLSDSYTGSLFFIYVTQILMKFDTGKLSM